MGATDWLTGPRAHGPKKLNRGTLFLLAAIALVVTGSPSSHADDGTAPPQLLTDAVRAGGPEPARFLLTNGRTVIGRLVRVDDQALVIRRPSGGIATLPLDEIVAISVRSADGELRRGRIARLADGAVGWATDGDAAGTAALAETEGADAADAGGPLIRYDPQALVPDEAVKADAAAPAATETVEAVQAEPAAAAPSTAESPFVEPPGDAPPDSAPLRLTVTADRTNERDKLIYFRLTLSEPAPRSVLIIYTMINGSAVAPGDYTHRQGVVVFEPGEIQTTVATAVVDDSSAEGDESFTFFVTGDPATVTIEQREIAATIEDNDG